MRRRNALPGPSLSLDDARRLRARESLYWFVREAWPILYPNRYVDNWHIRDLCDEVQALVLRQTDWQNLVINVPPGSAKSTILLCVLPWMWLRNPRYTALYVSGAANISLRDSMRARKIVLSAWYRGFGHAWTLAKDQNAKGWWRNTVGGERQALTIGSSLTGQRVDDLFVDDPNDAKDVTELKLQAVEDAYTLSLDDRLVDLATGRRCLIQQRTHTKDLTGVLMEREPDGWRHVVIRQEYELDDPQRRPMDPRAQPGELYFPARFPRRVVEREKVQKGSIGYSGQHQQRPVPPGGGTFRVECIEIVQMAPAGLRRCRGWDFAWSQDRGDYTVGALLGMEKETGTVYIIGIFRKQVRDPLPLVEGLAKGDGLPVFVHYPKDPGAGSHVADAVAKRLRGFRYRATRPPTDRSKEDTWIPFASYIEAGMVKMVAGEWNQAFLDELVIAPRGAHDDQIDACVMAFSHLTSGNTGAGVIATGDLDKAPLDDQFSIDPSWEIMD